MIVDKAERMILLALIVLFLNCVSLISRINPRSEKRSTFGPTFRSDWFSLFPRKGAIILGDSILQANDSQAPRSILWFD